MLLNWLPNWKLSILISLNLMKRVCWFFVFLLFLSIYVIAVAAVCSSLIFLLLHHISWIELPNDEILDASGD